MFRKGFIVAFVFNLTGAHLHDGRSARNSPNDLVQA